MTLDPRMTRTAAEADHTFWCVADEHDGYDCQVDIDNRQGHMDRTLNAALSSLSDDELVGNTGQVVKAEAVDSNTHLFVPDPAEPGYCERCGWGVDSTNHTVFRLVRLVPVGGEEE